MHSTLLGILSLLPQKDVEASGDLKRAHKLVKRAVQQGRREVGDATNKERHVCGRARVGERPVSWARRNLSDPPELLWQLFPGGTLSL